MPFDPERFKRTPLTPSLGPGGEVPIQTEEKPPTTPPLEQLFQSLPSFETMAPFLMPDKLASKITEGVTGLELPSVGAGIAAGLGRVADIAFPTTRQYLYPDLYPPTEYSPQEGESVPHAMARNLPRFATDVGTSVATGTAGTYLGNKIIGGPIGWAAKKVFPERLGPERLLEKVSEAGDSPTVGEAIQSAAAWGAKPDIATATGDKNLAEAIKATGATPPWSTGINKRMKELRQNIGQAWENFGNWFTQGAGKETLEGVGSQYQKVWKDARQYARNEAKRLYDTVSSLIPQDAIFPANNLDAVAQRYVNRAYDATAGGKALLNDAAAPLLRELDIANDIVGGSGISRNFEGLRTIQEKLGEKLRKSTLPDQGRRLLAELLDGVTKDIQNLTSLYPGARQALDDANLFYRTEFVPYFTKGSLPREAFEKNLSEILDYALRKPDSQHLKTIRDALAWSPDGQEAWNTMRKTWWDRILGDAVDTTTGVLRTEDLAKTIGALRNYPEAKEILFGNVLTPNMNPAWKEAENLIAGVQLFNQPDLLQANPWIRWQLPFVAGGIAGGALGYAASDKEGILPGAIAGGVSGLAVPGMVNWAVSRAYQDKGLTRDLFEKGLQKTLEGRAPRTMGAAKKVPGAIGREVTKVGSKVLGNAAFPTEEVPLETANVPSRNLTPQQEREAQRMIDEFKNRRQLSK